MDFSLVNCIPVDVSSDDGNCPHPTLSKDICLSCGDKLNDYENTYLQFACLLHGLHFSPDEANRLSKYHTEALIKNRKLLLVLDLDNTLIDSVATSKLTPREKQLLMADEHGRTVTNGNVCTTETGYVVKLRPFVQTFLKETSALFQLWLYTNALKAYTSEVLTFLDPQGTYFANRVITRNIVFNPETKKSLCSVLGDKRVILIVDDRREVWREEDRPNLIKIKKYFYFSWHYGKDGDRKPTGAKSLSEKETDERESFGPLAAVLQALKHAHALFFSEDTDLEQQDVIVELINYRRKLIN